ncbi:hypothetical protein DdX_13635 [Ditylenchus destructor]|uniref:Uncharacterized protein n=1 Tax=Ditylenchus destructor TaxID=166010 RepID=A0AAD4R2H5_9BILA|nr:hypothetical protein DdX_13635 [Ditylenchus destructor]
MKFLSGTLLFLLLTCAFLQVFSQELGFESPSNDEVMIFREKRGSKDAKVKVKPLGGPGRKRRSPGSKDAKVKVKPLGGPGRRKRSPGDAKVKVNPIGPGFGRK